MDNNSYLYIKNISNSILSKYQRKQEEEFKKVVSDLLSRGLQSSGPAIQTCYDFGKKLVNDMLDELIDKLEDSITTLNIDLENNYIDQIFSETEDKLKCLVEESMKIQHSLNESLITLLKKYKEQLLEELICRLKSDKTRIIALNNIQKSRIDNRLIAIDKNIGQINISNGNSTINAHINQNQNNFIEEFESNINSRFGFKFLYPKTWDRSDPMNNDGNKYIHPTNEKISITGSASFSFIEDDIFEEFYRREKFLENSSNHELIKSIQSGKHAVVWDREKQKETEERYNILGYKYVYIYIEETKYKVLEIYCYNRNVDYCLRCEAPIDVFDQYENMFNYIASKFYVLDGAGYDIVSE